jgi:hypothetical protein
VVNKPFDASLNALIDDRPDEWAAFLAARAGIPPGPAEALDTDLSLTVQADKVFRINGPVPALVHLELESSSHLGIPDDLLRYNVLLRHHTGLPVHTVLMLLRPKANATDQTGDHAVPGADGRPYLHFRYTVVRVWEESVEQFLSAGVGLAPLALLTNEADANLAAAFIRFRDRLQAAALPATVTRSVFGSAMVLSGLRHHDTRMAEVLETMAVNTEESSVYQWILRKGRIQQTHAIILRQAARRFGTADEPTSAAVRAIQDVDRLDRMTDRIPDATGWADLLATE